MSDRWAKEDYVTTAIAALGSVYQPVDSDLTAIAALTTTSYGRAFLALADAAAGRTALGLGTAATHATGDYDAAGAAAAAQAASQPLDSDLTAIAALSTTSFGRSLLALADAAALRTAAGLGAAALLADPITAAHGGTGLTSLTAHALQVGNGTGNAVQLGPDASTTKILQAAGSSADPAFVALSGDATIAAGGAVTLKNTGPGATGPLGDATHVAATTIDAQGRVTALSSVAIAIPESAVTSLVSDLALKAPLASPALTGSPTAPTQTALDSSTKIATTSYVDSAVTSAISGLSDKPDVAYAATSALPACTYANGSSGVGATLTGNANGPLLIDGVTILLAQAGERVLIAGQAAPAQNGWYTITQVGVVAVSPFILTRATESDQAAEIGAGYLTGVVAPNGVTAGSNNGKLYISVAADPFVVGTTSLTFSQVGSTYSAGTGLGLSGQTFSIDTAVTVDKTTAQTLTNKTLTSPVINTPTGIVKGDVGLGNVDNTSNATERAATATLTNKKLSDTTTTIVNASDATKIAIFDLSGATTGKTATLAIPVTLNRTITLPDATDTLVGKATTDTLTNKTLTSPVLNTGVSGTAIDTDSTMAANSDTILASQKATKTALALKAPLAAPTFTGTVTSGGDVVANANMAVNATAIPTGVASGGSAFNIVQNSIHVADDVSELTFIGTGLNFAATIDLRRVNATYANFVTSTWSAVTAGQNLGGAHIGATTPTLLLDCATFYCRADGNFADGSPADSAHANTPTRWDFLTVSASASGRAQVERFSIDSAGSIHLTPTITSGRITGSNFAVKSDGSVWIAPSAYTSNQPSAAPATISAAGAAALASLTLVTPLAAAQGGTGATSLANIAVLDGTVNTLTGSPVFSRASAAASVLLRRDDGAATANGTTLGSLQFQGTTSAGNWTSAAQVRGVSDALFTNAPSASGRLEFLTTLVAAASIRAVIDSAGTFAVGASVAAANATISNAGAILSNAATAGVGYGTGAGGTVTQATNKSTGVTLNTVCGKITMNNAALANATNVGFTLTDSAIAATDLVAVAIASGGTTNSYTVTVDAIAAGSCHITLRNISGGSLSEAVVITFAVVKAVTS